jgi:hypothetical protein
VPARREGLAGTETQCEAIPSAVATTFAYGERLLGVLVVERTSGVRLERCDAAKLATAGAWLGQFLSAKAESTSTAFVTMRSTRPAPLGSQDPLEAIEREAL